MGKKVGVVLSGCGVYDGAEIHESVITLLALDAEVGLVNGSSFRVVALDEFFLGYKKLDLRPSELVKWVRFRPPGDGAKFNFEKVSKRTHLDIASVNTAISLKLVGGRLTGVHVSAGGVAPIPRLLERTMAVLEGREPTADAARAAAETARAEIAPITDVRGSAEYKKLLLGQLMLAHFQVLFNVDAGQFVDIPA